MKSKKKECTVTSKEHLNDDRFDFFNTSKGIVIVDFISASISLDGVSWEPYQSGLYNPSMAKLTFWF